MRVQACVRCHPECKTCIGNGLSFCTSCKHFTQDDKCVSECAFDFYLNTTSDSCYKCDPRCLHCTGPTASDCVLCKEYKVYDDYEGSEDPTSHGLANHKVWLLSEHLTKRISISI